MLELGWIHECPECWDLDILDVTEVAAVDWRLDGLGVTMPAVCLSSSSMIAYGGMSTQSGSVPQGESTGSLGLDLGGTTMG